MRDCSGKSAAMTVSLPADLHPTIRAKVATGRYGDGSAVIRDALEAPDTQEHQRFLRLRERVFEGYENGPGDEMTPELWANFERKADEMCRRGELPHVNAWHLASRD